jgi:hypothetical protein
MAFEECGGSSHSIPYGDGYHAGWTVVRYVHYWHEHL